MQNEAMAMASKPCLAIIPARGGSKGLPGKNIRPLAGLPLIVHALRCAQSVQSIAKTIVSTDSQEIADVVRAHGGEVPFLRPAELAQDNTPTLPVLRHALEHMESVNFSRFESVLLLEPTSPGRLPEDIDAAFALLDRNPAADGVIDCSQPDWNPFYVGVIEKAGFLAPAFPEMDKFTRRQDVPEFLRINGLVYLWRSDFIRTTQDRWLSGHHVPLLVPEERAISIDTESEFQMAELKIDQGVLNLPWLK